MYLTVIASGVREVFDLPDDADLDELGDRLHWGTNEGKVVAIPRRDHERDALLLGRHIAGWWFDDAGPQGAGFS